MTKLQDIYLLATLLWLGWNTAGISTAQATINHSQQKSISWSLRQSQSNTLSSQYSISTLNKSDRFELLAQNPTPKSSANTSDDKIRELKELKQLEDLLRDEALLKTLQEQNFNVDNLEQLEQIQTIVNNKNLNQEEILEFDF